MSANPAPAIKAARKARIVVVDDHPLFCEGVVQLINRQTDLACCAVAANVAATRAAVLKHKPDLVLLDLRLGNEDGLELIKDLKNQFPTIPILVVSQYDEALYAERALRAGALGYVMKEEAAAEVLSAIRAVLAGELYVSRKMGALVLHKLLQGKPDFQRPGIECLTDRELQVFQMLGTGLSSRQVSAQLHLSIKTIETYRENIKHKLGLHNAPELLRHATEWAQGHPSPVTLGQNAIPKKSPRPAV